MMANAAANGKKLIEWGWVQPNTGFMRQHIAEMEQTPFDGTVFDPDTDTGGSLCNAYWGSEIITYDQMSNAVANLKATPFRKFTDNFLRLNVTPYALSSNIDWFDNFDNIINNSLVAAQVAKEGGVKGIIIDTEQYTQLIWDYSKQKYKSSKSYNQYAAQVRLRGSQIMQAFQQKYPDLTLFLSLSKLPRHPGGQRARQSPAGELWSAGAVR